MTNKLMSESKFADSDDLNLQSFEAYEASNTNGGLFFLIPVVIFVGEAIAAYAIWEATDASIRIARSGL